MAEVETSSTPCRSRLIFVKSLFLLVTSTRKLATSRQHCACHTQRAAKSSSKLPHHLSTARAKRQATAQVMTTSTELSARWIVADRAMPIQSASEFTIFQHVFFLSDLLQCPHEAWNRTAHQKELTTSHPLLPSTYNTQRGQTTTTHDDPASASLFSSSFLDRDEQRGRSGRR